MFSCHLHRISCRNAKQFSCFFGEDHTLIIKLIGFFCRSAAEFHKLINRHIIRHDHQIDIQFFVSGRKLYLFHGYFCKRFHASVIGKLLFQFVLPALICICIQFVIAGLISHKNPLTLIRNQIPGYATALGTQSSAATIPVNLQCAEADGVSSEIRNFTVPLCANIHMAGSMITITACATAVCLMNQLPISIGTVIPFIMTLGIAMVASPGAPGGSIMTALPFLYMIFGTEAGDPSGPICAIMVALYITQDSFGTACNVSGDNAIGVIVETIYRKFICKSAAR